jgi:hypothetical protein
MAQPSRFVIKGRLKAPARFCKTMTVTNDECKWHLNGALRSAAKIAAAVSLSRTQIWLGDSNDEHLPEIDRNELLLGGKERLPHGRHPATELRAHHHALSEAKCLKP